MGHPMISYEYSFQSNSVYKERMLRLGKKVHIIGDLMLV